MQTQNGSAIMVSGSDGTPTIKVRLASSLALCLALILSSCAQENTTAADMLESATPDAPLRIAAAANLSDVLPHIVSAYTADKGRSERDIEITFASSGKLYAQIKAGAPYDIFLSANQDFPAKWAKDRPATTTQTQHAPFTYTQGQLAFYSATREVGALNQTTLAQLLATPSNRKIAIANPELAPYGASATAYLRSQNIYESLTQQKRLIQAENIGQAFQYANTGHVDYGFVAQSQVTAAQATAEQFYTLAPESYPAILQDGIVLSDSVVATDFTHYLLSPTGQRYFVDAGYLAVRAPKIAETIAQTTQ